MVAQGRCRGDRPALSLSYFHTRRFGCDFLAKGSLSRCFDPNQHQATQLTNKLFYAASWFREKYMRRLSLMAMVACAALLLNSATQAQQPLAPLPPPPHGDPITLEQAKKVAAAAETEARKLNLSDAIAIVEPDGKVVFSRKWTEPNMPEIWRSTRL